MDVVRADHVHVCGRARSEMVRDRFRLATSAERTFRSSCELASEAEDKANVGIVFWR